MSKVSAEEISSRVKKLLDELALLGVHAVVLASLVNKDSKVVFGMEMNTSQSIVRTLLKAATKHMDSCDMLESRPSAS